MFTLLRKYLWPMMKHTAGFYLAMILVSALAMMLLFGAASAIRSYEASNVDYNQNYGYPDARIQTDVSDAWAFSQLSQVEGVEQVDVRTFWMKTFKVDTRLLSMKLTTLNPDGMIKLYDIETAPKSNDYPNIYLERYIAQNNKIKAGDIIQIEFDDIYYPFYVEKLIQSCETSFFQVNNLIQGDYRDLGCAYIDVDEINKFYEREGMTDKIGKYNECLLKIDGDCEPDDVLESAVDALPANLDVNFSSIKDDEANIQQMHDLISGTKKITVALPLVFYATMLIVVLIFMMQVIRNNHRNIGILMMLGYKKRSIGAIFSFSAFIISLVSVGLGIEGSRLVLDAMVKIYRSNKTIPYIISNFDYKALIVSAVFTVVIMQVACLLSMVQLRKITPASVVNDDFGMHGGNTLGNFLSSLPADLQIAAGSIKQNPRRTLVSIFAIIAAYVLIFIGVCANQGMLANVDQYKNDRLFYDAQIIVLNEAGYDESQYIKQVLLDQDFITGVEQVGMAAPEFSNGDYSRGYQLIAMKTDQEFVKIPSATSDSDIQIPHKGIVLDNTLARNAGVEVGDTIMVDGKEIEVAAISDLYAGKSQYMSFAQLRELGIDYRIAFFVTTNNEEKLLQWLNDQEFMTYTIFTSRLIEKVDDMTDDYYSLTKLEILFAMAIAFMVITVMTISSFDEQRRRLSILRVLGYQVSRISRIWLIQFIVYLVVAMALALPAATLLGKWFMIMLSGNQYTYPFIGSYTLYIASFVLVVVMYLLAHFFSMFAVRRQKLAECIKSRE